MHGMRRGRLGAGVVAGVALAMLAAVPAAQANVAVKRVSIDPYTNTTSFHKTQVEADTFAVGNTIVSAFQVGRFQNGGASNVGWGTSVNGGAKWKHGYLPATTKFAKPAGPYDRATDPSVGYDTSHKTWMIVTLGMTDAGPSGVAILVSRSADGLHWSAPVVVQMTTGAQDFDKTWVVCDDTASSLFYGHCYVQWDDFGNLDQPHVSTSTDGGATWKEATLPAGIATGGQPLVQPNGSVIMPIDDGFEATVQSYVSHDGGLSFAGPFQVAPIVSSAVQGGLRAPNLISADMDGLGRVYVVWYDCRFRVNCTSNDIVMSTSLDGSSWTPPVAIPIDASSSTVDHFLPGIGADPTTSGTSAHLGVTYSFYPNATCTSSTCQLSEGFISSTDGGLTWGTATQLAGPFTLTWLPNTTSGYMVGDYVSTSFVAGKAHTVFASASAGTCQLGAITSCDEMMVSPKAGLAALGPATPVRTRVLYHGAGAPHTTLLAVR